MLQKLIEEHGLEAVMNRRSPTYKELGLDKKKLSTKEALDLMQNDVNLIKRPLVIRGKEVAFGYDEAQLGRMARK